MSSKVAKPVSTRAGMPAVEADERHQVGVDGFIERNRDDLNASIGRSRTEVEKGVQSTRAIDDIIADGRKRHDLA